MIKKNKIPFKVLVGYLTATIIGSLMCVLSVYLLFTGFGIPLYAQTSGNEGLIAILLLMLCPIVSIWLFVVISGLANKLKEEKP